jgi:hypothetical protein
MTVELIPPFGRSLARSTSVALTVAPDFMRTRNANRWHRPRSGQQWPDGRITYSLWCGPGVTDYANGAQVPKWRATYSLLTASKVPPGEPVCGTCEGRAIGVGQIDNDGPRDLIFEPRYVLPPKVCPGARFSGLFTKVDRGPGRVPGAICAVCGFEGRIVGGDRGYRWLPLRVQQHAPLAGLVAACPFHAWNHLTLRDRRAVCACTTAIQE